MSVASILISGGGIAGLTLAIRLKELGFVPVVIERDPALRTEGYMMDFFGTGWDVAERMGLVEALRSVRYPIDALEYVDGDGRAYARAPIARIRRAVSGRYVYLRRSDLERILYERAQAVGVPVAFGRSITALEDGGEAVRVTFDDGGEESHALVVGADGVHSNVRRLAFGEDERFSRFLGYYVAAFHFTQSAAFPLGRAAKIYEETDRIAAFYPLDAGGADATYVFRYRYAEELTRETRLALLRRRFAGAGWIAADVLETIAEDTPLFFDPMVQIVMPRWNEGRIALVGDACGCLTLLAGQGSHMAMAGAYVLAEELARHPGDHAAAFAAYEAALKEAVARKQREAQWLAKIFVPRAESRLWLRRFVVRAIFSGALLGLFWRWAGARSVLAGYRPLSRRREPRVAA
jgi:2-polyprenyl-6-methoxyphenol hydroxylase-like FAD-dependent oxidoreductase